MQRRDDAVPELGGGAERRQQHEELGRVGGRGGGRDGSGEAGNGHRAASVTAWNRATAASTTAPAAATTASRSRASDGTQREGALDRVVLDGEPGDEVGRGIRALGGQAEQRAEGLPLGVPLPRGPGVLRHRRRVQRGDESGGPQSVRGEQHGVDGIPLVRHGGGSAGAGDGELADLGAGEERDVASDAGAGGDDRRGGVAEGEHGRAVGVPCAPGVVESELRGRRGPQARRDAGLPLVEREPGADRAAELHREAGRVDDLDRARDRVEPGRDLRAERGRLGVLAERARDREGRAFGVGQFREARARRDEPTASGVEHALRDEHEGGVEDVLARGAVVHAPSRSRVGGLGLRAELCHERDHGHAALARTGEQRVGVERRRREGRRPRPETARGAVGLVGVVGHVAPREHEGALDVDERRQHGVVGCRGGRTAQGLEEPPVERRRRRHRATPSNWRNTVSPSPCRRMSNR